MRRVSLFSLVLLLLRVAARLVGWLDRRAAISAAQKAILAEAALKVARRASVARRIEEEVNAMSAEDVRGRLRQRGDFRQ